MVTVLVAVVVPAHAPGPVTLYVYTYTPGVAVVASAAFVDPEIAVMVDAGPLFCVHTPVLPSDPRNSTLGVAQNVAVAF